MREIGDFSCYQHSTTSRRVAHSSAIRKKTRTKSERVKGRKRKKNRKSNSITQINVDENLVMNKNTLLSVDIEAIKMKNGNAQRDGWRLPKNFTMPFTFDCDSGCV